MVRYNVILSRENLTSAQQMSTMAIGKGETGRDALCSVQVRGSACLSTTVLATDYLR